MTQSPSSTTAALTLAGYGLLVVAALALIIWLFARGATSDTTSIAPSPTPLPEGVYSIDDQLDQL